MKRFSFILMLLLLPLCLKAQEAAEKAEKIKNDPEYLWGEGFGDTYANANQQALANLVSKISVNVRSEFTIDETEINSSAGGDFNSVMESVVKTYAHGNLSNTHELIISTKPEAHVLRYIKTSEVQRMFKEREDRIMSYIASARNAERESRIDDALRNYYWALCLLKSLQHPNAMKYRVDGIDVTLTVWIPEQINSIVSLVKGEVTSIEENMIGLLFTYKGNPVTSLDFHYWDGQNFSNIESAKDGIAEIEMRPGADMSKLDITYEYEYTGQMNQDNELQMVSQVFNGTKFPKAKSKIIAGKKSEQKKAQAVYQEAVKNMSVATHAVSVAQPKNYIKDIESIVTAIRKKDYASVQSLFSPEGYNMFTSLINYGQATIMGNPEIKCYDMNGRVICRSVPMKFKFKNNKRSFVEDVTFTFNKDNRIETVAFGLDKVARDDIFNRHGTAWNDTVRMVIATFLENYKTAFALKRLDYIKSIFDDDAIIIVGHMVKTAKGKPGENQKYLDNKMVKYNRIDKKQYIKNLEKCFASNEFINIRFYDNEVSKMGKGGELFGIQIHQDYYSSSYADTGYLFLMVDINDADQPIIKVRTWQPHRDPNINSNYPKDDRHYGLIDGGIFE